MYLVVAHMIAKPDRRAELLDNLIKFAAEARAEVGCQTYRYLNDIENELSFSSVEIWDDRTALEAHLGSAELSAGLARLGELVAGSPSIVGYEVTPNGATKFA
jgi:quinol monooxygenase YgiN